MKSLFFGIALCAAALPALAQNVSISVGQPGFYGRVNIGDFAGPPVLYGPRPVIIDRGVRYGGAPIYLRVPRGERLHWGRYCGRYGACGLPVLFVQDDWYVNSYVPRYREHYGHYDRGYRGDYRGGRGPRDGWDHGRGPGGGREHFNGPGRGDGGRGGDHGDRGGDHGGGDHGHR
jgi:hypothetical protein